MKPKRLISLLVAVCMMVAMLPLSAVTAFAASASSYPTPTSPDDLVASDGTYWYAYKENADDTATITITDFLGPVDSTETPDPYIITVPTELNRRKVTGLGEYSFAANSDDGSPYDPLCSNIQSVTIPQKVTSIGNHAFFDCFDLENITIPQSVTSIGDVAFGCCKFTTLSLGENIETIGGGAFWHCSNLSEITIPENVKEIKNGYSENIYYRKTFEGCSHLKCIILPAGFKSFEASLRDCPTDCVIYYNNDWDHAKDLLADNDNSWYLYNDNGKLKNRNFLYLCKVTFDANGGDLTGNLTNYLTDNLTDHAEVPVYTTEKITETIANDLNATDLDAINAPKRAGYKFIGWYTTEDGKPEDGKFDVKETAITDDITLYARWEFDPNALDCHPLTVTGGTVTVKYDGSDVTSELRSTDAATGQKTYSVPDGAEVTVTLDKNLIPKGNVFDSWSTDKFSLPQDQDHKAETITFPMNSDADIAAEYRDAATDHTPDTDTAVCHPLTVTGGIVTVKKGDKDVTDTLTVTTDETTGKKTYSVPDGAEVTVKLDKTLIPEGMVFDIWSTGKFSLPLGQDYKAETITFTMSSDADIAAQYRDATIEDDGPNVLGTAAIIGTAAVGTAVLGYQAYSLGAEFACKLMALPYFPSNRSALAMMLWEDAGKPMPESELLYPDVGQEERDMDLQHAARWAMENELIPDLNDEGTAPEEMKFFPANPVSKLDVLNAWQKAQELKNN